MDNDDTVWPGRNTAAPRAPHALHSGELSAFQIVSGATFLHLFVCAVIQTTASATLTAQTDAQTPTLALLQSTSKCATMKIDGALLRDPSV